MITLTLRAVTGFWSPSSMTVYANDGLQIKINRNGLCPGKAVLIFNGTAFLCGDNDEVNIPSRCLREENSCIVQVKNSNGSVAREWTHIETLHLDLAKLDKEGEAQMIAERELLATYKEECKRLTAAYEKNQETIKTLAAEVVKQGNAIAELRKDIEAIKSEPIV